MSDLTAPDLIAGAAALFSLILGLGGMIFPRWAQRVVRLVPDPAMPGGQAEFRASFGGLWFGLGLAVIASLIGGNGIVGTTFAASLAWIFTGIGRGISMARDGAATRFNAMSLVVEIVVGLMLLGPFVAHIGG